MLTSEFEKHSEILVQVAPFYQDPGAVFIPVEL